MQMCREFGGWGSLDGCSEVSSCCLTSQHHCREKLAGQGSALRGENGGVTLETGCGADRTGMTVVGLMTAVVLLSLSHYQKPRS